MKKQNLLLVFALVLGLANGQDIHAKKHYYSKEKEVSNAIKLYKSRSDLNNSIRQTTAILDTIDKNSGYVDETSNYVVMKKTLNPIAALYTMGDTVYKNVLDFSNALRESSSNNSAKSEHVERWIGRIQPNLKRINDISSKIKNIVTNAIITMNILEGYEKKEPGMAIQSFRQNNDLMAFFKNIGESSDNYNELDFWEGELEKLKKFQEDSLANTIHNIVNPNTEKNFDFAANEVRGCRESLDLQKSLLRNIVKEVYEEVKPGSKFRNALNNLDHLVSK